MFLNPPSQISLDLIVYGVKGLFHNVDESVYNGNPFLFRIVNNQIQSDKDIDMNNKKIIKYSRWS